MANIIGKTPKTFYEKMKKGVFDSDEITAIVAKLEIENPMEIFLPKKYPNKLQDERRLLCRENRRTTGKPSDC